MNNCYVCGANLGIYSRGIALDKSEKYIFCSNCYWTVMAFHKPLHKIASLEDLDKLEKKLDKKIGSGKLKDRQIEALKACYEEKRVELKIQAQMLAQYESCHSAGKNPIDREQKQETKSQLASGKEEQSKLSRVTTADTLSQGEIHNYLGPISAQKTVDLELIEQEKEFDRIKRELAFQLLEKAQEAGGDGVIGLKYTLTPFGADKMLLMGDGTAVK